MERTIQFEAPTLIILAHGHLVLLVQPPRTENTKIYTKHQKHYTPSNIQGPRIQKLHQTSEHLNILNIKTSEDQKYKNSQQTTETL